MMLINSIDLISQHAGHLAVNLVAFFY